VALTRQADAAAGNLLLRCSLHSAGAVGPVARGASAPTEGGDGRGILWRPPAYTLFKLKTVLCRLHCCWNWGTARYWLHL